MINNCRSAIRAFSVALLIAAAGQAYAQISRGLESQGLQDQADACAGAGLASKPVVCRAAGDPSNSKYNLLYADDAPEDDRADDLGDQPARHAREGAYRDASHNQTSGT